MDEFMCDGDDDDDDADDVDIDANDKQPASQPTQQCYFAVQLTLDAGLFPHHTQYLPPPLPAQFVSRTQVIVVAVLGHISVFPPFIVISTRHSER